MNALPIVVGIICNSQDQVLIAKRRPGAHLGGFWEFPGGKIESGETSEAALQRECLEEVNLQVIPEKLLLEYEVSYSDRRVHITAWWVAQYTGVAVGREKQAVRWVARSDLEDYEFPSGNRALLDALKRLP